MRKSGFIMLLLACLLAFVPVVAFTYGVDNGTENTFTSSDLITKTIAEEEVAVYSDSEILTVFSVSSIDAINASYNYNMTEPADNGLKLEIIESEKMADITINKICWGGFLLFAEQT